MLEFYKKRQFSRFFHSPFFLVPFALLLLWFMGGVWGVHTKEHETRAKRIESAAELEALEQRATALEAEIDKLSTPRGQEEEIRQKFEVAREGEEVIVILDPEEEEVVEEEVEEPSLWQKILNWF